MHQDMYDPKHRFFGLSSDASKKEKTFQKGLRESLLCDDCEQQFGLYERYASGVFYGCPSIGMRRDKNVLFLTGLQYPSLKLFLLSLLWRMGITSLEYLKGLDLGAYEPRLREMLRSEQASDFLTYPCLLATIMHEGKHIPDLIVPPAQGLLDGQQIWTFVAAGFVFSFFCSNRPPPVGFHPAFLKPDGTMCINVAEMRDIPFLHQHAMEIAAAQSVRSAKKTRRSEQ
jgi:hypothetical protein